MPSDDAQTSRSGPTDLNRRTFIKGVIAGGVAVSSAAYLFRNSPLLTGGAARTSGVERLLTLNVNGQTRRVDVAPHETLATTLRYKLGLTGTKLGCDRAECGACTVLVDDVPRYSCSVLTHAVRSRDIRTIEGLASPDGTLHPVAAGRGRGAGLPVRLLHDRGSSWRRWDSYRRTRTQLAKSWLMASPATCAGARTTTRSSRPWNGARSFRGRWPVGESKLVGQNYVTPDLVAKVTGQAKYAEDFRVDGMLYAKLLLSPLPHGPCQEHRHERRRGHAGRARHPQGVGASGAGPTS